MTQATAPLAAPATDNNLVMRRRIALTMLFLVGTINFVDRQLLSILVEPVRAELDFTDTQFGLLTGLAFALFYAAMGVPVAMLADRWNRVKLIGIACVVYSGFTMACGMVSNFWQLALMRFGVGAGEAGGTAPSLSVLADYYPPAERPFAIGLLTLNGPFGVFVGAAFGAWAAANIGWRGAFMVIGAIGMAFVPIMLWLVREPARGQMDKEKMADEAISFSQSLALFIRRRSLRLLLIGSALAAFVSYGMLNWIPAFLMRTQKMPLEAMATYYAPAAGITFGIGILGGGWLVSQRAKISPRAYGSIPALASLLLIPTFIMALMADSWQMSLALLLIPMAACTVYVPPALALVQNLTPPRSRATAAALLLLVFNIIGLGMGPVFTGVLSDMLKASFGDDSLRFALIGLVPFAAAAGIAQFSMTRHLDRDFAE
ncbi:spinster family MFS transporter [Sphingopyxis yananensis]|uniref:spinster family MFS transporter n=1 Tax=Sphingopyxis yananensis TaxID=2886687 RepID=UPI001D105827|nr:MFS transporter [Sphingopyxis yananensis]MCC2602492.1 MFS transporter [Sphingopyxis yananensis]